MGLDMSRQIQGHQPALLDDKPAAYHCVINVDWSTERDRRDWVVEGAGVAQLVDIHGENISTLPGLQ